MGIQSATSLILLITQMHTMLIVWYELWFHVVWNFKQCVVISDHLCFMEGFLSNMHAILWVSMVFRKIWDVACRFEDQNLKILMVVLCRCAFIKKLCRCEWFLCIFFFWSSNIKLVPSHDLVVHVWYSSQNSNLYLSCRHSHPD